MPSSIPVRAFISALASASVAMGHAPAIAQAAAAATPLAKWQLDWDAPYCKITTGNAKDAVLSIWTVPGSNSVEIYLIGTDGRLPKIPSGTKAFIALADGTTVSESAFYPGLDWQGILQMGLHDDWPVKTLGKASAISLQAGGKQVSIPIAGGRTAMRALQDCVDSKLPEWGIEPAALRALAKRPKYAAEKPWLTYEDYPEVALQAAKAGIVVARLTINTSGRVSNCTVVQSSGVTAMDYVTCKRAQQHARYEPAIGADGKAVETPFIAYASFKLFQP